jgi:superfamily I DNA/RNA helicase
MFESLTDKQREIVFDKSGKFVVRACPGSGKTYCVSARLSRLINEWDKPNQGIATLSFTNVAWQEIEKKYKEVFKLNASIHYPHFLGTIDSFINKYIFLPFGHLILGCNKRPILVGEPHGIWTGRYFSESFFDNLSYDVNGNLYALNPRTMPKNWPNNANITGAKTRLIGAGFVTQSDANYFALKILQRYPGIAKAVASRFPTLIVDEAQDTSEIQMSIIDLLIQGGLDEVMMVGDPDQAIFEWNNARPDLLLQKFNAWPDSIVLNESRRSSQRICNFTYRISSLGAASTAIDPEVQNFTFDPKVITYADATLPAIIETFVQECVAAGIEVNKKSIAVLYRSKSMINEIAGIAEIPFTANVWSAHSSYTKDFARGKFFYDNGDFKKGFPLIEKAIVKLYKGLSHCRDEDIDDLIEQLGFIVFRSMVFDFIKLLPLANGAIGAWVDQVNANFKAGGIDKQLQIERAGRNINFQQLFLNENEIAERYNYRLGTVHGAKGETFEATLLILKKKGIGANYTTMLRKNIPISDSEELRIAYVGLTRPKKILVLAVPDDDNKLAWEGKLSNPL